MTEEEFLRAMDVQMAFFEELTSLPFALKSKNGGRLLVKTPQRVFTIVSGPPPHVGETRVHVTNGTSKATVTVSRKSGSSAIDLDVWIMGVNIAHTITSNLPNPATRAKILAMFQRWKNDLTKNAPQEFHEPTDDQKYTEALKAMKYI